VKKLSIIIPAYNEQNTIKKIIRRINDVDLTSLDVKKEIVVVDDGSKDETPQILKNIKGIKVYSHKKNSGKGRAIRTGIKHATGDIILIQDADLEYNPKEYPLLIKPILRNKTGVVYGSRYLSSLQRKKNLGFLKKVHDGQYFLGYIGSRVLTLIANLLYGIHITDEATGYKVFRREVIKNINLKCEGFEFCPEVTAKIAKKGYKILEVPISYRPRKYEEGKKINWKHGIEAILVLVKYRFFK